MRKFLSTLCTLIIVLIPNWAFANDAEGYWLTENKRAVIHVKSCDTSLCGNIYWIIEGGMLYDDKNPDPRINGEPMCDLALLRDFKKDAQNWKNGKIYKADEGKTYDANITIKDKNTLKLRGYVGIPLFGKSQTWTRVSPDNYTRCKAPE